MFRISKYCDKINIFMRLFNIYQIIFPYPFFTFNINMELYKFNIYVVLWSLMYLFLFCTLFWYISDTPNIIINVLNVKFKLFVFYIKQDW
jgi:hypothetical protein